jgi:hypothetical protein
MQVCVTTWHFLCSLSHSCANRVRARFEYVIGSECYDKETLYDCHTLIDCCEVQVYHFEGARPAYIPGLFPYM